MEWWRLIVLLNCVSGAISVHIELYYQWNFTDLFWQGSLTTACYNLPVLRHNGFLDSIITDTCVIVYGPPNCKLGVSYKIMPGKHNDLPGWAMSMHLCTDEEGGPQLNLDITTDLYEASSAKQKPNILERYDDVCECVNVPQYVQNMSDWSIDNHHNQLFAYYEPNCKEQHSEAYFICAGHSSNSWFITSLKHNSGGIKRKIQSFSPVEAPYFQQSCSIMKMERFELSNITSYLNPSLEDLRKTKMGSRPRVQFFENPNLKEFVFESQSTDPCTNLPKPNETDVFVTHEILSIKTDTCVIVCSMEDCKGRSFKLQPPGSTNLTKEWEKTVTGPQTLGSIYQPAFNWKWHTKSFSPCLEPESGLNVDVTEYQSEFEERTFKVLKQYRDICTCQNIPRHVWRKDKWSIYNFGSSLVAYFEDECQSEVYNPLWIPAGRSSFSMGLGLFKHQDNSTTGTVRKIRSIGPDPAASYFKNNCVKLFSTIIKFEIDEPTSSSLGERNDEMLASKTIFRNDGPSQLTQSYSASKTVRESVQVDIGKGFSNMNSVHVDKSVDIETRRHEGSSESKSTASNTGWSQSESSSMSETEGSEYRESQSKSTHESTDSRESSHVGVSHSATVGAEVGGGFFGYSATYSASATFGGSAGQEHSTTNTRGSSSGSESSKSVSASRTSGRDISSGQSGGTSVGRENSANYFKEDGFKQSLRKAYEKSGSLSSSSSKSSTTENTKSFEVTQEISVPPCTEQVVHASVKVVTNKLVDYRVIAKITGHLGDREMTSHEVRQFMGKGLEYIGDFDDHTVIAYGTGTFTAEYGVSSIINSHGSIIESCHQRLNGCPVCQTCTNEYSQPTVEDRAYNLNIWQMGVF